MGKSCVKVTAKTPPALSMVTLGARRGKFGWSQHLHHQGDAEVDGEVEKEDITEEEAKDEEKKVTKGAQVYCTFCTVTLCLIPALRGQP